MTEKRKRDHSKSVRKMAITQPKVGSIPEVEYCCIEDVVDIDVVTD